MGESSAPAAPHTHTHVHSTQHTHARTQAYPPSRSWSSLCFAATHARARARTHSPPHTTPHRLLALLLLLSSPLSLMLLLSLRRCCGSLDSHSPWRPRRTASDRRSFMARACRRVSRSHRVHPLPPTADPCNNDTGGACGRPSGGRLESVHVQPFCALALDIPVRGPHSGKGHAVARLCLTDTRDWTVRVTGRYACISRVRGWAPIRRTRRRTWQRRCGTRSAVARCIVSTATAGRFDTP